MSLLSPSSLGFPPINCLDSPLAGQPVSWIPGVKVDAADWRLILWHTGDLRRFRESGGDMDKAIIHFLSHDDGVIRPLWGTAAFKRRMDQMRERGVKSVIAPDFSSWADMPIASQLYNYYRSAVVAHDLAKSGFNVIPNVCWSAPQIRGLSISMWGPVKFALIDAAHFSQRRQDYNYDLFWDGANEFKARNPDAHCWIYCANRSVADAWSEKIGSCVWCPSRVDIMSKLWRRAAMSKGTGGRYKPTGRPVGRPQKQGPRQPQSSKRPVGRPPKAAPPRPKST